MKVSLITVCYNSAKTLGSAFESVLTQNHTDIEYLIIDGGSKDNTVEVIKDYAPRFQQAGIALQWISERDQGMYDAINKGIRMATGEVVGILNADDFLQTDSVLRDVANAFVDDTIDALYGDIRFIKTIDSNQLDDLRQAPTRRYYSAKNWKPWMGRWGYMVPHPSVYIRKPLFEQLGYYKLGYHISADFELMIRYFCRNRLRTTYLPQPMVGMRLGGKSTNGWRSNILLNQENARANRENGYFCYLPMMFPKYAFKIWEFVFTK